MIGILGSLWPFLLAGAGILFGVFGHLRAKSAEAVAGQKVAEAQTSAARAQTQIAEAHDVEAQANAVAAQAGADSVKEKVNVTNDVSAMPAGAAADELRSDWTR